MEQLVIIYLLSIIPAYYALKSTQNYLDLPDHINWDKLFLIGCFIPVYNTWVIFRVIKARIEIFFCLRKIKKILRRNGIDFNEFNSPKDEKE